MQEDLKISIGANTRKAEEDIKKLGKIVPEFTAEIALKFKKKNELQNEIKNIQNELDKVALNPKAFDKEQVKQWRAQIKEAKKEIKELKVGTGGNFFKEAYEEAKRLSSRVKEIKLDPKSFSTEDIKILRSEIEATALKAKALNFAEGTGKSQNLVNQLKNSSLELDKINNQSGHTKKAFGMMDIAVGNLAATLAVKVLGALKEITLEGIKFNQQMEFATEKTRTISASGGASINSNTWRIAKDTGVNPLELKEGLYQVVSAIGDTHKKYALLETANKLATVGFSTTTESVNGLTTVLNAYNLEIEDADRIANIFVRTQKVGKLTVQEFNRELYKTVPVAKELRIGIDEVGASIALLTAKGSKAEIAQTQMGAFMYELLDVGSDVSKLFTQISGQSLDSYMSSGGNFEGILRQLKDYSNANNFKIESLFGRKEAKSFWLNIGNDIDGYINKLNAINDPINELQRNFENLLNTEEKRLARANNYWLQFKQTIGSVAGEVLASIGDLVTG
ncbi:MAG: phage tail tape measure protein, partial [Cetobacterium sp.]